MILQKHCLILIVLLTAGWAVHAQESDGRNEEAKPVPEAESSTTTHSARIGGSTIRYTAVAGTMILNNDDNEPIASMGYTAYFRDGVSDLSKRPIMFAYNGGPGSSSIWLHMGVLGPVIVTTEDASHNSPPFSRANNEYSILDRSDLVMVDPVGTGLSVPVGEAKGEDFWGVDQDISSVSAFIKQFLSENNRWMSPKFVLGESYGGIRTAGVAYVLQTQHGIALDGVILVSPFMSFAQGVDGIGEDLPHVLFLPSLAATAWYHKALASQPDDLVAFLAEVKAFAIDEYSPALMKGNGLSDSERNAIAARMSQYLGVSTDYILRANLRIAHTEFTQELLRSRGQIAGRIDSRFTGNTIDALSGQMDYDPFFPSIGPAFTANFLDYYHGDLDFGHGKNYKVSGNLFMNWDWGHQQPGSAFPIKLPSPNTIPDLAQTMIMNPDLRVLVQQGYYDLATPYFATEYAIDHMEIPRNLQDNVRIDYYEAGHMMYLHPDSLVKYKNDLAGFIDARPQ